MKKILAITLASSLLSCSHLSGNRSVDKGPSIETKDVSVNARGEEEAPRHRLLILPFLDERPDHSLAMTDVARKTVVSELLRTHQFVVVPPEDFPQDPKKFLTEENEYDLAQVARQASAMGVAAVVEGKVMSIKAKRIGDSVGLIRTLKAQVSTTVRVRVFAGKNGKEILNELRSADTDASSTRVGERGDMTASLSDDPELIRAAIRKAFSGSIPGIIRAVEKLGWEGRVAMVSG
ncbi:MAG: hypothetical protein ACXVA9_11190, partial [Bdellovibrionales bacterium]